MTTARREQLVRSLASKEYRQAFVVEQISTNLAFQIRLLRESRGWTQEDLAKATGKAQETISQLENPNYGSYTLNSLKKLATAFDVALLVKFVPFSRLVDETLGLTHEGLAPKGFEQDTELSGTVVVARPTIPEFVQSSSVLGNIVISASSSIKYSNTADYGYSQVTPMKLKEKEATLAAA